MKFKTFNLRAYHRKDETILSFVLKGGRIPTSRILYIKKGVLNPTHGLVFINKEIFKEFVEWKEATRYKSYKK